MKTKVLFLLTVLLTTAYNANAQRGIRIGYIDMEYILENVDEYQKANTQLGTKVQKWKGEIEQRKSAIEQMKKDLSVEKVLLTKELAEEREEEIAVLEKELLDYQQDRFGPQGDLIIQRNLLAKPVQDQVFAAVQEIAKNKRYDMVFDRADAVMLYALEKHDISDLVLRSINRAEKKAEREKKAKRGRQRFSEDDTTDDTPVVDPEVEARKLAAQEKREQRQKELEDLKQKKIADREAKKKAYEERRQQLLAAREAKKKAKEEARNKAKEDNEEENEENNEEENN